MANKVANDPQIMGYAIFILFYLQLLDKPTKIVEQIKNEKLKD